LAHALKEPEAATKSRRRVEKIGDGFSHRHDTQPAYNVIASCKQKVSDIPMSSFRPLISDMANDDKTIFRRDGSIFIAPEQPLPSGGVIRGRPRKEAAN